MISETRLKEILDKILKDGTGGFEAFDEPKFYYDELAYFYFKVKFCELKIILSNLEDSYQLTEK